MKTNFLKHILPAVFILFCALYPAFSQPGNEKNEIKSLFINIL